MAFSDFYAQFLSSKEERTIKAKWEALYPEGPLDLSELERPFNEEEIRKAEFSLALDKSPGPDGFPFSFYQRFWGVIKNDVLKLFQQFYNHSANMGRLNYSFIALIPKKSGECSVKDFRTHKLDIWVN